MGRKPKKTSNATGSKPKFPYTTTINALRKILQEIPKRPKPTSFDFDLIKTWGIEDTNARTALSVIKNIGLIDGSDSPTSHYVDYMKNDAGPANLAARIKGVYSQLFETSHEPFKDSLVNLRNFFNIHSGGGAATINYQIQTFKTLCEFGDFSGQPNQGTPSNSSTGNANTGNNTGAPTVNINLHIHLPETKSRADYEEIIKDIAKYIYQK